MWANELPVNSAVHRPKKLTLIDTGKGVDPNARPVELQGLPHLRGDEIEVNYTVELTWSGGLAPDGACIVGYKELAGS
jgi:hypothetical protein